MQQTCTKTTGARLRSFCEAGTKICPPEQATALLEAIIAPGDRVPIEGENQKQADLLARPGERRPGARA
jgi:hypothetical protein